MNKIKYKQKDDVIKSSLDIKVGIGTRESSIGSKDEREQWIRSLRVVERCASCLYLTKVNITFEGTRRGGERGEGRGERAEGRGQRAEGRGQRAEGRGQRAEGRGQRGGRGRVRGRKRGDTGQESQGLIR